LPNSVSSLRLATVESWMSYCGIIKITCSYNFILSNHFPKFDYILNQNYIAISCFNKIFKGLSQLYLLYY